MIKRTFSFLLLLLYSVAGSSIAHDSNVATLLIVHLAEDKWVFEVKTPLYGLDQSLRVYQEEKTGKPLEFAAGSKEYKELLVGYIKAGFDITAESEPGAEKHGEVLPVKPTLGSGRIKLDDHQTVVAFEIKNMPEVFNSLKIHLPYMSQNEAQFNIVRLIDEERATRYVLSTLNNFEAVDVGFFNLIKR